MAQSPFWPLTSWQANFVAGVHDPDPTSWEEMSPDMLGPTARVVGYSTELGKQFELDAVESGSATVKCRNIDEHLNPANTGSPWNSGGNSLKPYRRIRHWAAWPLAGNLLNATNDPWTAPRSAGTLADTAGFDGATTGTWSPVAGCSAATSTTHVHDGARAMLVTWGTTAGGAGVAEVSTPSVPLKGAATYTASVWVWIGSGPAVTLACQGQAVTSTTTTGAWQRLVLTWSANNQPTDLRLYAAGATTSGQQVWVDSVQVEAASAASAWASTGPTVYPVHSGYIERYPLTWTDSGKQGWAELTSVDALALLSRILLHDVATQDCLQDSPDLLWPLWDDAESVTASSIGAVSGTDTSLVLVPMGSPTQATTTFGDSSSPSHDSLPSLKFSPTTAGDTFAAHVDWSGSAGYSLGGSTVGYTVEFWFRASHAEAPAVDRQMHLLRLWGASSEEIDVRLTAGGLVSLFHRATGGGTDATVTTVGTYVDDVWHHVAAVATSDGVHTHEKLIVDGVTAGSTTRASAVTMVAKGVTCGYDYLGGTDSLIGNLSRVAVYPTALSAARVQSHWLAGRTGFAGDTTGGRIARLLAYAGWTAPTSVPNGSSRHGPLLGLGGGSTSALDAIKVTESTEHGSFYAAPGGKLTLLSRSSYYSQTASGRTFGEDSSGGETPYIDGAAELDPTYIYNSITVTRDGGVAQVSSDAVSNGDYGARTTSVATSHATDADAASLGAYLISQYADGRLRVPELAIDPASNPDLWPVALGTQFGDRVTWKRRTSAGLTVVLDGFVEHITHDVAVDQWTTKFQVSPVDTFQAGLIGTTGQDLIGSTFISTY